MKPTDPRIRHYTDEHIRILLGEVHERGKKFGLVWPSATTDETLDGRVLVCFNTAPVSTLLNLLNLLLDAEREISCDS
ncbi:hypothetical protein F7Q99_05830 [Streptomyces kaniharaensis]|uniref:Uncharacterized protein n=1 Tax=Streptomyces kaniharaensis TaxID=212423 RepID=A0A6N7KKB4_9ACTN|nr:hypothetical protein [Streptomyces kaniharaensis]MQS11821.1 hypothetical protein [Streptomyces kaniharaensis]